jgi:hypothetical protein
MSRVRSSFYLIAITLICWTIVPAVAQVDLSNSVLLRTGSKSGPSVESLDSGRYKIREPKSRDAAVEMEEEKTGTSIPSPVSSKTTVKAKATAEATTTVVVVPSTPPEPSPVPLGPQPEPQKPSVTTQVKELILGGTEDDIADYRNQIHPQDPRANAVEISMAPAYYYNDTSSSYSFHNYNSSGPGYDLRANLWLTPFFGLQSDLFTSLSSSVRSGGSNAVAVEYQVWDSGLRFRKHFGYSRKSSSVVFGIDYTQSSSKIARAAIDLVGSESSGVALVMESTIPSSVTYAHTFGIAMRPHMHEKESATSISVTSGTKGQTNGVELSLGGQWTLDRRNQVFWKLRHNVERTLYEGSASQVDPQTGVTPNGVTLTNSTTMFYFGFRWGS